MQFEEDIECYNYGQKGYLKKDDWSLKEDEEKKLDKGNKKREESSVKIEKINVVSGDSEEGD